MSHWVVHLYQQEMVALTREERLIKLTYTAFASKRLQFVATRHSPRGKLFSVNLLMFSVRSYYLSENFHMSVV